jgi:hypothetical protein
MVKSSASPTRKYQTRALAFITDKHTSFLHDQKVLCSNDRILALTTNIRLGRDSLRLTNTIAYHDQKVLYSNGRILALTANIRLGRDSLPLTNTLDYHGQNALSSIGQAPTGQAPRGQAPKGQAHRGQAPSLVGLPANIRLREMCLPLTNTLAYHLS